jgi:hypothetical protein
MGTHFERTDRVVAQFEEPITTRDLKDFRKLVMDIESRLRDTKKRIDAEYHATMPNPKKTLQVFPF